MEEDKHYDILACLKDIEQAIIEIYEFIPREKNFLVFLNDL
jgi:hypothetical protein